MLITSKQIKNDLEFRYSWISARLNSMAEEAMYNGSTAYRVDNLINGIQKYTCNCRNPKQKIASEKMMTILLVYLKELLVVNTMK